MQSKRYRKISQQPFQALISKKPGSNQPQIQARALSLSKSVKKLPFVAAVQSNRLITGSKRTDKQFITLNLKQRRSVMTNKDSKKSRLQGLDKIAIYYQKSKSLRKTPQLPGLSKVDLEQRKESHLNTYFNIRKNKLKEITKENKKIYERINSQKSLYSSRQLSRSVDSVSRSRISQKNSLSSSRKSIKSKVNLKKAINLKRKQTNIKFQSKDVNKLQNSQVNHYLNIFCNRLNIDSKHQDKKIIAKNVIVQKENNQNVATGLEKILQQLQKKRQVTKKQVFGRLL